MDLSDGKENNHHMNVPWYSAALFAQDPPDGGAGVVQFLPFVIIGILFYVMLVRPERRKRAELDNMLKELKKNDRVVTIGGIFGTVVQASPDSDDVTLKIDESNNTRIRVLRSSISRVLTTDSGTEAKSN